MVKRRKGKCRRAAAFFLSAAMTVVNGGTSYIPAYAADVGSSRFLLTNRELMQAIQDAKAAEDFFDFSSLDLKGKSEKAEERYEELLGEQGTVYQLDVDVDGSDAADGTKLELFYNEENEEVVFLYINESDESVRFTVNVDGYETKSLLVGAASAELTDGLETADGENGNSTEESTEETSGNSQETEGSDNVQNPGGSGSAGGGQGSGTGGNASEDSQEPETGDTADTEETGDAEEPSDGDAGTPADDEKLESGDTGSAGNGEISEETGAAGDGAPADGEKPEDGGTGSVGNDDGAETGGDTGASGDNGADGGAAGDVGSGEESGDSDTGSAGNGSGDGGSSSAGNNSGNSDSGVAGNDGGDSSSDTGTSDGGNSGSNTGTSDGGNSGSNTGASGTSDGGDVQIGISAHSTAFVAVGSENKIATEGEWILEEGDTDGEEIPEVLGTLDGTVYPEVTVWEGAKAAACAVELEELENIELESGYHISYVTEPEDVVEIDGPRFAEEGESISFSVIPEMGYQVTEVTANGVKLDCAYENSPATASQIGGTEYIYVIDSVDEDQEIVISAAAVSGTVFQAETETASITITAPEGAFAVPVTLEAKDIGEDSQEYGILKAQTEEKLKADGYVMTSFHPIDMSFVDEAEHEVEPAEAVKVNIHYKSGTGVQAMSELNKMEEKKIIHIHDQEVTELDGTLVEEINTGNTVLDAEVSQFSVVANVTVLADGEAEADGQVYATLEDAVAEAAAGAVIKLTAESIQLEDQIPVTKDVTIDMNGGMITAGQNKRVFIVKDGASLTLEGEGAVVGNGEVTNNGGLIHVGGESDSTAGTFILKDSVILSGGTAKQRGGAVYIGNKESSMVMEGGTIKESKVSATSSKDTSGHGGGGVYVLAGTFKLKDGVIQETTAYIGGGVFVTTNGEFLMSGGAINNTVVTYRGGGVAVYEGKFHMTGGIISGTQATLSMNARGGGVYVEGSRSSRAQFIMEDGNITGCYSKYYAGGVSTGENSDFDMSGGSIENNTANSNAGGVSESGVFNLKGGVIRGNKVVNNYGTVGNAGGVSVYGTFNMSGGVVSDNTGIGGVYVNMTNKAKVNITGGAIYNNANNSTKVNPISDIYLNYRKGQEFHVIPAMEMKDDLSGYQFNSWLRYDLPNVTDPVKMDEALDEIAVDSNLNKSFSFTAVTDADGREIYLDGVNGDNNNTGNSVLDAVKTFEAALAKAKASIDDGNTDEVKIYVSDTVTVSGTETWEVPVEYTGKITLTRYRAFDGYMVKVSGSAADLTLKNLVMDGGKDKLSSNYVYTSSMILVQGEDATLNIEDGTVLRNNRAGSYSGISYDGGAVYVTGGGICNMKGGQITGNESSYAGGGVTAARNAKLYMNGGVIENNVAGPHASGQARGSGGGVAILEGSSMAMSDGTILNNQAGNGGGIHVGGEAPNPYDYGVNTLTMTGGQIKDNTAESAGGGIYVQCHSEAKIKAESFVEITGNKANAKAHIINGIGHMVDYAGGGIYVNGGRSGYTNGKLHLTNVAISGNQAKGSGGGIGACPTSKLGVYVTDGGVVYDNTADTGKADQIYSSNVWANVRPFFTSYVSDYMLGGGVYLWKYDDGKQTGAAPRSYYQGSNGNGTYNAFYLDNDYDQNDVDRALRLANVVISDNYSGSNGGGIGTNGDVEIGVNNPDSDPATFKLQKLWDDGNNAPGLRPEKIKVTLKIEKDGQTTTEDVILKEENGWAWKLAAAEYCDADGNLQATITIDEETMERYELNPESIKVEEGTEGSGPMITISFENVFIPANGLTVYKVWKDGDNQDGLRPETISVQLYRNGEPMGDPVALSEATNWMYTWEDLPVRGQGQDLFYTVQEVGTVDGYTSEVGEPVKIDEDIYAVTIVNTHEPAVTKKTVTKVWDDNGNSDGLRPSSILVHLRADGEVVGEAELTAESGWTYTWEDLPVMDSGKTIKYTVEETTVPAGYMARYSEDTFTITNVHTPDGSDPTEPTDPDDPTPSNPGGSHGGGGGPNPGGPTPSGGPGVEVITPDEVPLANLPEESVEIPDEDVPLAALPKTGDAGHMGLKTVLFGALFAAFLSVRKRKEEQQ